MRLLNAILKILDTATDLILRFEGEGAEHLCCGSWLKVLRLLQIFQELCPGLQRPDSSLSFLFFSLVKLADLQDGAS